MDPNLANNLFKMGVPLFSILSIICAFGASHFSGIIAVQKEEQRKKDLKEATGLILSEINQEDKDRAILDSVGLLVTKHPRLGLSLFLEVERSVDKLGDVSLQVETDTSGIVSLYNSRDFIYWSDTIYKPLLTVNQIEKSVKEYEDWTQSSVNGIIVLSWIDGEGRKHTKKWPFEDYKKPLKELLTTGFIKDKENDNVLHSQFYLK